MSDLVGFFRKKLGDKEPARLGAQRKTILTPVFKISEQISSAHKTGIYLLIFLMELNSAPKGVVIVSLLSHTIAFFSEFYSGC